MFYYQVFMAVVTCVLVNMFTPIEDDRSASILNLSCLAYAIAVFVVWLTVFDTTILWWLANSFEFW